MDISEWQLYTYLWKTLRHYSPLHGVIQSFNLVGACLDPVFAVYITETKKGQHGNEAGDPILSPCR